MSTTWRNSLVAAIVAGLALGGAGIAMLWAGGEEFPVYPPPGIVILAAGAVFVALAPWRWAPGVGAFFGLFVLVGFSIESLVDGGGITNLSGDDGALQQLGTVGQLIGCAIALGVGIRVTSQNYRPASTLSR